MGVDADDPAHDGGGSYGRCCWYCFDSSVPASPASERDRFHAGMVHLDSTTALYDVYTPTCGSSTDIVFHYDGLTTAYGVAECQLRTGMFGEQCDRWDVKIDLLLIAGDTVGTFYEFNMHHMIRHEIGHTAGIHHPDPTGKHAMSVRLNDYDLNYLNWPSHEITCHINKWVAAQALC